MENALTFDYRKYITQYIDAFDRDIDVNNYETSIAQMNSAKQFLRIIHKILQEILQIIGFGNG